MSAPILAYEGLGLVQGSGWLFQNLDIFIGERDRLGQEPLPRVQLGELERVLGLAADVDDGQVRARPPRRGRASDAEGQGRPCPNSAPPR